MPLFGKREPISIEKNGTVKYDIKSIEEAALGIKELKLKKKEYALAKKEVAGQISAIRAEHSAAVGKRSSMVRGGGGVYN